MIHYCLCVEVPRENSTWTYYYVDQEYLAGQQDAAFYRMMMLCRSGKHVWIEPFEGSSRVIGRERYVLIDKPQEETSC